MPGHKLEELDQRKLRGYKAKNISISDGGEVNEETPTKELLADHAKEQKYVTSEEDAVISFLGGNDDEAVIEELKTRKGEM